VHQRYSTNTFPTWDLAQPFRFLCHNGEINTLRGNVNWLTARQALFQSDLFGDDMRKLFPIATPGASDSAILDNAIELLYHAGRSLPHAVMMLIPEAWQNHQAMSEQSAQMLATTGVRIQDMSETLRGMSGGQRQCVAIARAAGFAKKLIILDEPTAALGVQETARVEEIIRGLKARGVPLIIISHNLRQVFDLVDRIWVFRQGRIICSRLTRETSPEEIVGLITGAIDPASLRSSEVQEAATC
jgi:ABC-type dipeptide/oligopeptide/nickel transport system ATPase component